jgi:hypothetical protein
MPRLRAAVPGHASPEPGWNGVTIGVNVDSASMVDEAFRSVVEAGATAVAEPVKRGWGGYSGYVADSEGHRWKITLAPQP